MVSQLVREAVSTLVAPDMCDEVISRSLSALGLNAIPEQGAVITQWLQGPLHKELEQAAGPDAADLVLSQLSPMLAHAASMGGAPAAAAPAPAEAVFESLPPEQATDPHMRNTAVSMETRDAGNTMASTAPPSPELADADPWGSDMDSDPPTGRFDRGSLPGFPDNDTADRPPESDPFSVRTLPPTRSVSDRPPKLEPMPEPDRQERFTQRPTFADNTLPTILAATQSEEALKALRSALLGTAIVTHVPDLVGLLDALDEPSLTEPIVILDCQHATVHSTSVAALGEDFPKGTTVVLWGADERTWEELDRDRAPGCKWLRCSDEASSADVASLCSAMLR